MGLALRILMIIAGRLKSLSAFEWLGLGWLVEHLYNGDLKDDVYAAITEEAATRAGLELQPADPLSDASLANAISLKFGVPIRSVKNQQMIVDDLENYACGLLSERIGYQIRSLRDRVKLEQDFANIITAKVSERTGISLRLVVVEDDGSVTFPTPEQIQDELLIWALPKVMAKVREYGPDVVNELLESGSVEFLVEYLNNSAAILESGASVEGRKVALLVAEKIGQQATTAYGKWAMAVTKRTRRKEQNRIAQADFRARHGNRRQYKRLADGPMPWPTPDFPDGAGG